METFHTTCVRTSYLQSTWLYRTSAYVGIHKINIEPKISTCGYTRYCHIFGITLETSEGNIRNCIYGNSRFLYRQSTGRNMKKLLFYVIYKCCLFMNLSHIHKKASFTRANVEILTSLLQARYALSTVPVFEGARNLTERHLNRRRAIPRC